MQSNVPLNRPPHPAALLGRRSHIEQLCKNHFVTSTQMPQLDERWAQLGTCMPLAVVIDLLQRMLK